jgi:predicted Rossmann-fold nucleotide-binding protein
MANLAPAGLTVAIFASDKGPGDPERSSLMGEVGRVFARKGARMLCLAEGGALPVPLITAARTAGGTVEVVADASIVLPPALADVSITVLPDAAERHAYLSQSSIAFVALPGSLASVSALFGAWSVGAGRPVVMLNRHRAFEVLRGFATDVMAASVPNYDRNIQFAETVEDLWNKVVWVSEQRR